MDEAEIRKNVRKGYGEIARNSGEIAKNPGSCCGTTSTDTTSACCGSSSNAREISSAIGYTKEEMDSLPDGANLGLGCGNPVALASLKEGETVIDLGSGAGIDCFLAANKVGKSGKVIGIDMTADMLDRARKNARKSEYENVEFRLGEIENLPVADNTVDVLISNCVINLSPDKARVFNEAFRVLKPGGRLMVSDIVLLEELPEIIKNSIEAYVGCVSGANLKQDYIGKITDAGFKDIDIVDESVFPVSAIISDPTAITIAKNDGINEDELKKLVGSVSSIKVSAKKPT